jgi:hypothetical protein
VVLVFSIHFDPISARRHGGPACPATPFPCQKTDQTNIGIALVPGTIAAQHDA